MGDHAESGQIHGPGEGLDRRRAIGVLAAAAGAGLAGLAVPMGGRAHATATQVYRWRGIALGAPATIAIHHRDEAEARRLIALSRAEIERLEAVFSLYRPTSALARLNGDGRLDAPPLDLVTLLSAVRAWSARTSGAFDATVQPLWRLYAAHFAVPGADPAGPPAAAIAAARALIDYRAVQVSARRIAFARPGMALTLNGIAQGYITDRVADLLRAEGMGAVLIDVGEIRALWRRPDGAPWRVGIADPAKRAHTLATLEIVDKAVATSAATGTVFDPAGRYQHILDPRRGRPGRGLLSASVVAARACDADALSTALLADPGLAARVPDWRGPDWREVAIERIVTVDSAGNVSNRRLARAQVES